MDIPEVIECAAELVDQPGLEVSEEYRHGVVELATRLCLCGDDFEDAVVVMGYAVCGVNKHPPVSAYEVLNEIRRQAESAKKEE